MKLVTILLILHIIGASLLIGIDIIAVASVVKPPQTKKLLNWLYNTGKFGIWLSFWELLTGTLLFFQRSTQLAGDHMFWVRTGLYITGSILVSIAVIRQSKKTHLQHKYVRAGNTTASMAFIAIVLMLISSII